MSAGQRLDPQFADERNKIVEALQKNDDTMDDE